MGYQTSSVMDKLSAFIVIYIALSTSLANSSSQSKKSPEIRDYCEIEQFNPKCRENEAILIRYARFGRMRVSRCISGDGNVGPIGCYMDAKFLLDQKCSGRKECDAYVGQIVPIQQQQCKRTYRSYLEVAFECVPVAYAQREICSGPLEVKATMGYLSSRVAEENGCGTLDSPWFVSAKPGQQIQFTLLDFGGPIVNPAGKSGPACHVYAIIKEESWKAGSETICQTGRRNEIVYKSLGNMVEVRLVVRSQDDTDNHFLLKYEAMGCPDIPAPLKGWVQRMGPNEAVVGCNRTGETSHVTCEGNEWKGKWSNCTEETVGLTAGAVQSRWTLFSYSHGLSIFVVVCIALAVGIIILGIGLMYLRRRGTQHPRNTLPRNAIVTKDIYNNRNKASEMYKSNARKVEDANYNNQGENDYYKTWQMQRHTGTGIPNPSKQSYQHPQQSVQVHGGHSAVSLPSPPPYYADGSTGSSMGYSRNSEHIYESPKFSRKSGLDLDSDDMASPTEYYELDVERVHT